MAAGGAALWLLMSTSHDLCGSGYRYGPGCCVSGFISRRSVSDETSAAGNWSSTVPQVVRTNAQRRFAYSSGLGISLLRPERLRGTFFDAWTDCRRREICCSCRCFVADSEVSLWIASCVSSGIVVVTRSLPTASRTSCLCLCDVEFAWRLRVWS